jgi:hypothetical protein
VEYATDLVFRSAATLKPPLYEQLTRESVLSVKAEQVASFLRRQITPQLAQEPGSQFSTRIEGTSIKHPFGQAGTVGDSSERSSPDVVLNLDQLPGDRRGPTPEANVARPAESECAGSFHLARARARGYPSRSIGHGSSAVKCQLAK